MTEKTNFPAMSRPKSPVTQISLLNKMKRKRGSSGPERSPVKRRTEHLSHVELPRLQADMNIPSHFQPPSEYELTVDLETPSETPNAIMDQRKLPEYVANQTNIVSRGSFNQEEQESWKSQGSNSSPEDLPGNGMLDQRKQGGKRIGQMTDTTDITSMTRLQEVIESQFSLEILLKHRELRLVDQEIAKCQIALEQLRRCQIIPYPAVSSGLEDMQAVSSGLGPSFDHQAQYPPPWGVTDGPYTRHYRKWLIPDPAFDGGIAETAQATLVGTKAVQERTTRGSVAEKSNIGHKSRSQRGSAGARLQALPHGYPEPKEEKGPMILKRSTDGHWVKLVCLDCRRDNFNSAQGFINHCRIAHNRNLASHDAAAQACGEEVDYNPAVGVGVSGEVNGGASTTGASVGLVHPLIRGGHMARSMPTTTTISRRRKLQSTAAQTSSNSSILNGNTSLTPVRQLSGHATGVDTPTSASFTPSSQTPHLSSLYAKSGRGGDLDEMVAEAKTKLDFDLEAHLQTEDDDQDQDMEDTPESTIESQNLNARGVIRGGRLPARAGMSPAPLERTPSSKGINGGRKPEFLSNIVPLPNYSSPYTATQTHQQGSPTDEAATELNLSPHTMESQPAPSLVSDDDYENTHSESEAPSSAQGDEEEDRYLDVEVEDHDEEIGLGGSSSATTDLGLEKAHAPTARIARRSSTVRAPAPLREQDEHIGFTGPVRRQRRRGMK